MAQIHVRDAPHRSLGGRKPCPLPENGSYLESRRGLARLEPPAPTKNGGSSGCLATSRSAKQPALPRSARSSAGDGREFEPRGSGQAACMAHAAAARPTDLLQVATARRAASGRMSREEGFDVRLVRANPFVATERAGMIAVTRSVAGRAMAASPVGTRTVPNGSRNVVSLRLLTMWAKG
jgi:hypothetical protein